MFGNAGRYERIDAVVRIAADPAHPHNASIVDLDRAPRDGAGRVHFEADLILLRPVDAGRANRNLLSYVVNRGRTAILPFSFPPPGFIPEVNDLIEPGDGFLLERGWTVALCGWQWDVVRRPGSLGLEAPIALEPYGAPAETRVSVRFQPLTARASEYLGHWPAHPNHHPDRVHTAYPAASLDDPEDCLTVREAGGAPSALPRSSWRFGRVEDGAETADSTWLTLEGGFEPGRIYELSYRTARCPVAGTGLLAIRDTTAFLRHATAAEGNPVAGTIDRTFGYGVSQCGRFLREFLHAGCNIDEGSRQVFDGVFVQIAGARRGEFNFRGAQPSAQYGGNGMAPPYAYTPTAGSGEGLIDRQRKLGGVPRIFEVNTANEYWRSDAMLAHSDPATGRDLPIPEDVRFYMFAGCQHGPGLPFLTDRQPLTPEQRAGNHLSILNYSPLTRAALVNLERWVVEGIEPPASAIPTLAEGTAIHRDAALATISCLAGVALPDRALLPETLVPATDADGNDLPGIRLPELSVPLATSTGWNTRHSDTGAPGQLADMLGSTIGFAKTKEARIAANDPRASLEERYRDRPHYEGLVREAAVRLAEDRHMLPEDVDRTVHMAGRLYDRILKDADPHPSP
jgi:hypothetical protein